MRSCIQKFFFTMNNQNQSQLSSKAKKLAIISFSFGLAGVVIPLILVALREVVNLSQWPCFNLKLEAYGGIIALVFFLLSVIGVFVAFSLRKILAVGRKKLANAAIIICALGICSGLLVTGMFSLTSKRAFVPDVRLTNDMSQLQKVAEKCFGQEGSFNNVRCDYGDAKKLCDNMVKIYKDANPIIHRSPMGNKYCAYVKLGCAENYWCIDSDLRSNQVSGNPSKSGYCDGKTFRCPEE